MAFLGFDTTDTIFENIDTNIDIPLNDETAYKMYSKYNWTASTSRLLDMQNIEWAPFSMKGLDYPLREFGLVASDETCGTIYTHQLDGDKLTTDVAIMKGEIKWARHHKINDDGTKELIDELRGDIELRISALTTLHFKKFAGIISVDTIGHDIIAVRLRMTTDVVNQYPDDWLKHVLRIYNRRPWGKP